MTDDIASQVADLQKDFRSYGASVVTGVEKAVLKSCLMVEREAKLEFRGSDEDTYTGSFPRVQTGRLRASITHRVSPDGPKVVGEVGTNVEYGLYLEYGTSRMYPHPFMGPAYDKHESVITEIIEKAEADAEKDLL
jgi:HK97 gp10 family phage protein